MSHKKILFVLAIIIILVVIGYLLFVFVLNSDNGDDGTELVFDETVTSTELTQEEADEANRLLESYANGDFDDSKEISDNYVAELSQIENLTGNDKLIGLGELTSACAVEGNEACLLAIRQSSSVQSDPQVEVGVIDQLVRVYGPARQAEVEQLLSEMQQITEDNQLDPATVNATRDFVANDFSNLGAGS